MTFDLLLQGGLLVDGTGSGPRPADVGIRGGRIEHVGTVAGPVDAARVVDLGGLVLAPGFIDIHTHSDISLLHDPAGESKVLQGVTTEVIGNCSFSPFPVGATAGGAREALTDHLTRLGDPPIEPWWDDLDGYADAVQHHPPALNVAALVGHGALRIAAMANPYGPATDDDRGRLADLAEKALEQGAFGFSTGLTHTPSSIGPTAEIDILAQVCARHNALYATHARAVAGHELDAIREALGTAQRTGVRLEYSHLALNEPANWGRAEAALELFERAATDGVAAGFDVYPYDASSSHLIQYLPQWVQDGGGPAIASNNQDPGWRRRALRDIEGGWFGGIPWHWDRITIAGIGDGAAGRVVGRTIAQLAVERDIPPGEVLLDLCAQYGSAAQAVLHYRQERDVTAFLAHPLAAIGSDGNALPLRARPDRPHPRAFGTFPRVLGRYVRDLSTLTVADAIHKMTELPAGRLGLTDRGLVRRGYVADLVAFDPLTVADRATFEHPRQSPVGVRWTIVAGVPVLADGVLQPERPGRFLRHG